MSKYPGRIVTDLAPAGYSVFFDGTGDYLQVADNAVFDLDTGDFTVEAWWYPTTISSTYQTIAGLWNSPGSNYGWILQVRSTDVLFSIGTGFFTVLGSTTITANRWYHVAATRSGTTIRVFLNGSLLNSGTSAASGTAVANLQIGRNEDGNQQYVNGYLSNVRIIKGTAVYTAAFTPPTQLLNITNTSLLTCNSPAIIDQSNNAFAITANGNAAVSTFTPFTAYVPYNPALGASTPGIWTLDEALQAAGTRQWNMYDPNFPNTTLLLHGNPTNGTSFITDASTNNFTITPFGDTRAANLSPFSLTTFATSGSGYFDGSGDYLQTPSNAALGLSTGDFTVECWYYQTSRALTNTIIAPSTDNLNIYINTSGILGFYDGVARNSTTTVPLNTWSHIALVRSGSTATLYYNGTAVVSQANTTNYATASWFIGRNPGGTDQCTGYCSNVRIVKGAAVYTGAFTTPTAPLTATQAAGTNISAITGTQTSLLTLQNSQSANNNAFLDSSSNNFLITRNGNTTQGSFSPFSQTGWSNFFDGSGDYLSAAYNSAYAFPGDFTIEFWVNWSAHGASAGFVTNMQSSGGAPAGWQVIFNGANDTVSFEVTGSYPFITSSITLPKNAWTHVAVVRSGSSTNNVRMYFNGAQVAQGTNTSTLDSTNASLFMGCERTGGAFITGYISNVRIVKGTAVYTTAFTPPAAPLTAITNTSLLTCQSNRFIDNSSNAFAITRNGDVSVQAFSPFYPTAAYTPQTIGGSGYFDGTGDYLSSATSTDLQLGSSDFSLEWWEYRTAANNVDTAIVCGDGTFSALLGYYNSGAVRFYLSTTGSSWNVFSDTSAGTTASNSWNHFVLTRSGTAFRVFLNGVLGAYATGSGSVTQTTNQIFISGGINGSSAPMEGYISGVRFVKGSIPTSYQTSSTTTNTSIFTSPTAPVTTTSQGATSGDVKYLVNFTNAGVVDSTAKNVLETVGNAQISTTQSKFGGSSMYFDGTGDNCLMPYNPGLHLSGDFTIECWIYPISATGSMILNFAGGLNIAWASYELVNNSDGINFAASSANSGYDIGSETGATGRIGTVSLNAWSHIAVTRAGNVYRGFVNGVQGYTQTLALTPYNPNARGLAVGSNYANTWGTGTPTSVFNGYIDDLRITRGFARYTGNFTPQTSQWQDQ